MSALVNNVASALFPKELLRWAVRIHRTAEHYKI
jgi:hypothetical protein